MQRAGMTCAGSQSGRAGSASVVRPSINSLLVFATASRPAWLVVSESWDDGWTATIDGRRADVLPADSALRAVRLSPGEHTVLFSYRPASFTLGETLSSVSLGIALGGIALSLWRRRRASRPSATDSERNTTAAGRAEG